MLMYLFWTLNFQCSVNSILAYLLSDAAKLLFKLSEIKVLEVKIKKRKKKRFMKMQLRPTYCLPTLSLQTMTEERTHGVY